MKTIIKRFMLLFSIGTLLICTIASAMEIASAADIYSQTMRLHVLANSDSDEDQAVKLEARDIILELTQDLLSQTSDFDDAKAIIDSNLQTIQDTVDALLSDKGFDYKSYVTLTVEYYDTREYEDIRLPAGRYLSLQVILGNGEGHNWWCVLFPPVCTSSSRADEELAQAGFTPNQVRLLTDTEDTGYTIKFKIVEVASKTIEKLRNLFK